MRKASILAALLLLAPSISHAKTLEDLLVEKGVISKGEAKEALGNAPAKVYYNGGTRLDFADAGFTSKINTLIQTRYAFDDNDEDVGDHNVSSFDIERAKLYITGNALHEEFSYALVTNFVGNHDGDAKAPQLDDAWLRWNGCDWFSVQMGQWKTGVSRQFVSGDQNLQFADRSIASDYFSLGRQAGAMAATSLMDGALTLSAGIYNGESDGEGINRSGVDTKHTGVLNARYNVMGSQDPYVEGDIDWTEAPALNIGAAYAHANFNRVTGAGDTAFLNDTGADIVNVDANFKYMGFSLAGEYYVANVNPDVGEDQSPQGFYVQAGYFLKPKTLEVAARYALIDCDDGKAGGSCGAQGLDSINEAGASVNYYWWKNQLKAQLGYDIISRDFVGSDDNSNSNRWILQLSAYL